MKKIVVLVLAVLLSHSVAFAGVATDVLNVTAQISTGAGECTVSTSPVDYGTSDGSHPVDTEGSITIQCPANLPYTIALDAGQFPGLDIRQLQGPPGPLSLPTPLEYNLRTSNLEEWGDDGLTYPAPSLSGIGSGTPETLQVLGTIDPISSTYDLIDGFYSDVVNVTVSY